VGEEAGENHRPNNLNVFGSIKTKGVIRSHKSKRMIHYSAPKVNGKNANNGPQYKTQKT